MEQKKTPLQEAQQRYYSWLLKNNYDEEISKKLAFRTEQEIAAFEREVLENIDKMSVKWPRTAEKEKEAFKKLDLWNKLHIMHYYTPSSFVDLLFL